MTARAIDLDALKALAAMTADDLGESEEDVKIRFVVPLLRALGHSRLRFEHKGIDILLKDGLPRGCAVVVETKRPDASLDAHLPQLERYSFGARSLLSVLTNGRQLRVYSPFWNKAATFAETLLWAFRLRDLAHSRHTDALAAVLSRDALVAKTARAALEQRQATVEFTWELAEDIRQRHREWRERVERRMGEIDQQMADLEVELRRCDRELSEIGPTARDKVRRLFKLTGVPLLPGGEFGDVLAEPPPAPLAPKGPAPEPPPPEPPRDWTEEGLRQNCTPYQRSILAAFVQAGKRTLGFKEIVEATGFPSRKARGVMVRFTISKGHNPRPRLMQVQQTSGAENQRRGNLYTIVPRYWPAIRRLYADQAAKTKKPRRGRKTL